MSVESITWALRKPVPSSTAKFVLVVLANQANDHTGLTFPSAAYLAESTGQDRKTVLSNLQKLLEWGLIVDTGKRTGQTGQIIVYRLSLDGDLFDERSQKRNSSNNGTVPKTEQFRFSAKQSRFSAKQSQKRDTEPSEPSEPSKSIAQRCASRFDEFWNAYPKRVGRKPALEKWKAKKLDAIADRILADIPNRIANDRRWLEGYIPNPATYLTQERWNDDLQPRRDAPVAAPPARMGAAAALESHESPLEKEIAWARHQRHFNWIDDAECERRIAEATARHREREAATC